MIDIFVTSLHGGGRRAGGNQKVHEEEAKLGGSDSQVGPHSILAGSKLPLPHMLGTSGGSYVFNHEPWNVG